MNFPLFLDGMPPVEACEAAADVLASARNYRVLRPLVAPAPVAGEALEDLPVERKRALILNTQTTGLDPHQDDLLEVGAVPIEYSRWTGHITAIGTPILQRRDIGRKLYPEEMRRAALTNEDLAGQRIDEQFLHHAGEHSDLVIAFHGSFHRAFVTPYALNIAARPWSCALRDIPWGTVGKYRQESLSALLASHAGMYLPPDGHADAYAMAIVALLMTPFADGSLPMQHLLETSRNTWVLVPVIGAPPSQNKSLKARGYRWWPGDDKRSKCWYRVVPKDDAQRELVWVIDHIFDGKRSLYLTPELVSPAMRLNPFGFLFA